MACLLLDSLMISGLVYYCLLRCSYLLGLAGRDKHNVGLGLRVRLIHCEHVPLGLGCRNLLLGSVLKLGFNVELVLGGEGRDYAIVDVVPTTVLIVIPYHWHIIILHHYYILLLQPWIMWYVWLPAFLIEMSPFPRSFASFFYLNYE